MAVDSDAYLTSLKLLIIGESGVGKSSLLLRFTDDAFDPEQAATIGVDFKVKTIHINQDKVRLSGILSVIVIYYREHKINTTGSRLIHIRRANHSRSVASHRSSNVMLMCTNWFSTDQISHLGHCWSGAVSHADSELLPRRPGRHPRVRRHKQGELHKDRKLARRARDVFDEPRHRQDARGQQGIPKKVRRNLTIWYMPQIRFFSV